MPKKKPKKTQTEIKQDKYVAARLEGKSKVEARDLAGYSPNSVPAVIDRPGSPIDRKLKLELAKRGLDESYLAQSYKDAIAESKTAKGRVGDYNAHAKLLQNLGTLLGYGKKDGPGVAIQINNGPKDGPIEPAAVRELLGEIESIRELLKEGLSGKQLPTVHEGSVGAGDSEAHSAVGEPAGESQEAGGGGQP